MVVVDGFDRRLRKYQCSLKERDARSLDQGRRLRNRDPVLMPEMLGHNFRYLAYEIQPRFIVSNAKGQMPSACGGHSFPPRSRPLYSEASNRETDDLQHFALVTLVASLSTSGTTVIRSGAFLSPRSTAMILYYKTNLGS